VLTLGVAALAVVPMILLGSAASASVDVMAVPTLSTQASGTFSNADPIGTVASGRQVTDTATLSGGTTPTGTIEFSLYGPDDTTCSGTPVFTTSTAVSPGGSATSAPFTVTTLGTYQWIASYGGDGSNSPVSGACGDLGESVRVVPAGPGAPTNVVATATGATSAVVSWTPPANASAAEVTAYVVFLTSVAQIEVAHASFPETSVVVSGLQPGSTYAFIVVAFGPDGGTSASLPSNAVVLGLAAATAPSLAPTTPGPSATAATLAVTGAPTLPTVIVGFALVAGGMVLLEIRRRWAATPDSADAPPH
jgi:Fibronectin type III domain